MNSIRALFGTDGSQNAVHGSDSTASAIRELGLIFPEINTVAKEVKAEEPKVEIESRVRPISLFPDKSTTLALIKPDAYGAGKKDDIVNMIKNNGFTILAEKEYTMTMDVAKEFYKEHEGKPFYETLTTWMSSAPIYAMKLERIDAVPAWRALMGPTNSEKAREEAPNR